MIARLQRIKISFSRSPALAKRAQAIWFNFMPWTKEMAHHWQLATASCIPFLSSNTERAPRQKKIRTSGILLRPGSGFSLPSRPSGYGQSSSCANLVFRSLEPFLLYAPVFMIRAQNCVVYRYILLDVSRESLNYISQHRYEELIE